ncbi:Stealth CR1 domain-containing protein [uncultured Psychrobacter sp.]|uniref:Stealth CR1 domain-containing protein n=1 Tax=uncultured Psychrobacter sp. TaxID=259303 RepID=UPI0026247EBC|nr:Stealth CR1 domain-containing protein [uncultured Psychrobacter sp.]
MSNTPIDFVVPWVDSSDPLWQESFAMHSKDAGLNTDFTAKRYRDWELFKYWFRGVEKNAPWVNKVHLITNGQHPDWLNLDHPKLNLINHEDYIPSEYLPVFSANPIELNIHRIKGLAEHFVYFNDDMFIKAAIKKEQFFKKGLPRDASVMNILDGKGISKIIINSVGILNEHFDKKQSVNSKPLNWFNLKYGKQVFRSALLLPWTQFSGFYDYHLPNPFLKSTFEEVWGCESDKLSATTARKFRHDLDINQYLFRYWQLAKNNFIPIAKHKLGDFYMVGDIPLDTIINSIKSSEKPLICLNDHDPEDLEHTIQELKKAFDTVFPEKSSFEL